MHAEPLSNSSPTATRNSECMRWKNSNRLNCFYLHWYETKKATNLAWKKSDELKRERKNYNLFKNGTIGAKRKNNIIKAASSGNGRAHENKTKTCNVLKATLRDLTRAHVNWNCTCMTWCNMLHETWRTISGIPHWLFMRRDKSISFLYKMNFFESDSWTWNRLNLKISCQKLKNGRC